MSQPDSKEIQTRPFTANDAEPILNLFEKVFGTARSRDEWEWKFPKHCLKDIYIQVAEDQRTNELIGQYALLPVNIRTPNGVVPAALSLDTMVDSRYRGLGLFTRLAEELYNSKECQKVQLLVGFPNANSFPGFIRRLRWRHLGDYTLCLRPIKFPETAQDLKIPGANNLLVRWVLKTLGTIFSLIFQAHKVHHKRFRNIKEISKFDASFDHFFSRFYESKNTQFMVFKDHNYMSWRYTAPTHNNYHSVCLRDDNGEARGYLVTSQNGPRGVIVDLLAIDSSAERLLIEYAVAHLVLNNAAYILGWYSTKGPLSKSLWQSGFLPAKRLPLIVRDLGGKLPNAYDFKAWWLMPGDNDTY